MNSINKILMIAEFSTPQYDEAVEKEFKKFGCYVKKIEEGKYLGGSILNRFENKLKVGPNIIFIWLKLLLEYKLTKYDLVYFRLCLYYPPFIIKLLKLIHPNIPIVCYMNDNPFSFPQQRRHFKYYIKNVPNFDINYIFRKSNFAQLKSLGSKNTKLHLPYYCPDLHHTTGTRLRDDNTLFNFDALFLGHGENDQRLDYFDYLLLNNINLKLGGGNFHQFAKGRIFSKLLPVKYFNVDEYRNAISNSLCSLCFFSSLNDDIITTRVFEIIACGGVLIAQRKGFVEKIFIEGKEALYFSSKEELLNKILFLKNNIHLRNKIALSGRKKLESVKCKVDDRVKMIFEDVTTLYSTYIS